MKKYLLQIEFRYRRVPKGEHDHTHPSEKITIGVYDVLEEACGAGNLLLEALEKKFKLHKFPDGRSAKKERFSVKGGLWGMPHTLVTNLAYLTTPFDFYARIETLYYKDVDSTIDEVLGSIEAYKEYKSSPEY